MKYGELTLGQMEAIVNKLGGMDGAMKFLRDELKLVAKNGKEAPVRALKKLAPKGTVTIPAVSVKKDAFFSGKLGVKIWTGDNFNSVVKSILPNAITCPEHQMDIFTLTENMWDSEIQNELGTKEYRSVQEAVASMISRIMMWKYGKTNHDLLTNGYTNIEHARAADGRILAVYCHFDSDYGEWDFYCRELDGRGDWRGGGRFSSPALGC